CQDTARKLYSTLVTAILTMTTLSFSVIMVVKTTIITEKLNVVIVKMAVTRVEYNFLAVSFSTIKSSKNVSLSKDTIHESAKLIIITISKVITLYTAGINQKLSLIFSHAFERFINKILHLCKNK